MKRRIGILAVALAAGLGIVKAAEPTPPLMRDFIGINGHTVAFRPQLYRPVAELVRDYHPVEWDLGDDPSNLPKFPFAKNGVDWAKVYGDWASAGCRIDVSLMFETVMRPLWRDLEPDARAYGEAFARNFGPSGRQPLVQSVEVGNEPGQWTDADYSSLARAMAGGLRAGDPRLTITTCNLTAGKGSDYAKSVSCLDGLLELFDVLTIHTYAMLEGWPTWRRSYPEDPKLPDYLKSVDALCEWRDAHAPHKPIWITEFGYDSSTKKPRPGGNFAKWEGVTDTQQAQWIVRSLLVFSSMPVTRAYIYFFNDADEPSLHGSSGLTRNFAPKPAFFAVAHLQKALGDYRFSRLIENRTGELRIQEYRSDSGGLAWVIWSPTGTGRSVVTPLPSFPGRLERAERMPLTGEAASTVALPENQAALVTESPLYLYFAPLAAKTSNAN